MAGLAALGGQRESAESVAPLQSRPRRTPSGLLTDSIRKFPHCCHACRLHFRLARREHAGRQLAVEASSRTTRGEHSLHHTLHRPRFAPERDRCQDAPKTHSVSSGQAVLIVTTLEPAAGGLNIRGLCTVDKLVQSFLTFRRG